MMSATRQYYLGAGVVAPIVKLFLVYLEMQKEFIRTALISPKVFP